MLLKNWKPGGSLDTSLAMAGGVFSFIAATQVAKRLNKEFPDTPFLSQILMGGSLSVATFLFSKHVFGPESEIPASLFTGTSSAYLAKYTEATYE
jgi:ABC-type enterobactin transport system permease subunit